MWRFTCRNISPVENVTVSIASLGEGYHNYHHVFPWDYKTSELGDYSMNLSTAFIDLFARIGWAYDLKYASSSMIRRRVHRCGDGSHIWGYGDVDISKEDLTELDMMNNHKLRDWKIRGVQITFFQSKKYIEEKHLLIRQVQTI